MNRLLLLLLPLLLFSCQEKEPSKASSPNIILFFVDDMGWQDTSVPFWTEETAFNKRYHTPNMERLAREGMKFTQAYATPVCSPTRVSLLSGMNAAKHRVTNWTLRPDKMQPMETNHEQLSFPFWNVNGLSPDTTTAHAVHVTPFPQILKNNGYRTIHAGKAHFGAIGTPGSDPLNLGFEVNIAGHAAGAPKSYLGIENFGNIPQFEGTPWPVPGLEKYHGEDIFLTEALTREAKTAIGKSLDEQKPFFLYMALYGIHTPIMPDSRFVQKYYDAGLDTVEAKYASMIEAMDKSLGDLMDLLEARGVDEETIILFMSDNGGLSAHTRAGEKHIHNRPLSSGKGSSHEGGIREPMIVKWPGIVQAGSVNPNYLIIEDFYPTILELAGVKDYESIQGIDGQSFVSELKTPTSQKQDRALYWHYPNEWGPSGPGIGAFSSIRKGDFKLIYYHLDQRFELFNISEDIGESTNLYPDDQEHFRPLAKELGDYLRESEAQMPAHKSTGIQVPYPDEVK